jgi:hypothetical protein
MRSALRLFTAKRSRHVFNCGVEIKVSAVAIQKKNYVVLDRHSAGGHW